jgi:hypothetical protein
VLGTSWIVGHTDDDPRRVRYTQPVRIAIELSEPQESQLRQRAKALGVAPEDLARAAVADLLAQPEEDFNVAADQVLGKNAELYRRLAR